MVKIKTGQRFGKWTTIKTIRITNPSGKKNTKWEVICDCGTLQSVSSHDLNKGKTTKCKSCYGTATVDLKGKVFSSWTVLEKSDKKNGKTHWLCLCTCGNRESVCCSSLTNKVSTRCLKCYQKTMPTHGYTCKNKKHPLYSIWMGMIARCENPKNMGYMNYGGRGISVCNRWHSLETFSADMGVRPYQHSIERIDNNGNYEPENCEWANQKQQANNKRGNRRLSHGGEENTVSQWAEIFGIKSSALYKYLERHTFENAYLYYTQNRNYS